MSHPPVRVSARPLVCLALCALAVLASAPLLLAQTPAATQTPTDYTPLYTKQEAQIPMRDGVRLYTAIYYPKDTTQHHPILMVRTPYSSGPYGAASFPGFFRNSTIPAFATYLRAGYIFVFQDVRGCWMSEGEFMDVRPYIEHKTSNRDVDETSDTYDTVEWLIHNVAGNNGRVGVRGTSYPGFYASMAAIDAHPAMKAVSPQAPVTEWMGGDDFMHHGALLLPHAFDFFAGFGRARPAPTSTGRGRGFNHGTPDGYEFFLNKLGALSNANPRFFHDSIAFWDSLAAHPTWDAFWAARSARPHLRNLRPARRGAALPGPGPVLWRRVGGKRQ
jgi:putative CocE/NonD family hydrolase